MGFYKFSLTVFRKRRRECTNCSALMLINTNESLYDFEEILNFTIFKFTYLYCGFHKFALMSNKVFTSSLSKPTENFREWLINLPLIQSLTQWILWRMAVTQTDISKPWYVSQIINNQLHLSVTLRDMIQIIINPSKVLSLQETFMWLRNVCSENFQKLSRKTSVMKCNFRIVGNCKP